MNFDNLDHRAEAKVQELKKSFPSVAFVTKKKLNDENNQRTFRKL